MESWHFVPGAAFESATGSFLLNASPLLKEEWHVSFYTLVADVGHPFRGHWARTWSRLAADDRPIDAAQVHLL